MIRQRVSVRGVIRPMESVDECETFVGLDLQEVGAVHGAGPILKWCVPPVFIPSLQVSD